MRISYLPILIILTFNSQLTLADAVNHYFGERLAVAVHLLVAFTALLLEDQNFVAFYMGEDGAGYGYAQLGSTNGNGAVVIGQQGVAQRYDVANVAGQFVSVNEFVGLNLGLLASYVNNCVHQLSRVFLKWEGKSTNLSWEIQTLSS